MVGVGEFASKVEMLRAAGIGVCAGAVGDPSAKEQIRKLRQLLDPSVYLFVNAMQGLRKPLSEEDIRFFGEIDNLFDYDRRNAKACLDGCVGGRETLFIDRKGDMYACPRSGIRMGNFYDDPTSDFEPFCLRKVCDVTLLSVICAIRLEENDGGWGFVAHTGKEEGGSCLL